ncbi:MAG: hypothetical protein QOG37_139, partial [Mycobacterium sp.]|nr:hypothetical protein [Mycobacterium sp.]
QDCALRGIFQVGYHCDRMAARGLDQRNGLGD